MAVFPDRIVLKNSSDETGAITSAIGQQGSDPIVGGELVVAKGNGRASLFTLDANGTVVSVGAAPVAASVKPSIILNMEDDGTDTGGDWLGPTPFPSTLSAKFGTGSMEMRNLVENSPRLDGFIVDRSAMPYIGQNDWTMEFWFKASPDDWDEVDGNGVRKGFQMILSGQQYWYGPGAMNVYLDPGTPDMPGGGTTNTSETDGQAFGSVVIGLGPGETNQWGDGIPDTGEIVSTRFLGVIDNAWHHVAFCHEGNGTYSAFVDGQLCQRTSIGRVIDFLDSGGSGQTLPVSWWFGGSTQEQADLSGQTVLRGYHGFLDSFAFYNNLAKYQGLFQFRYRATPLIRTFLFSCRPTLWSDCWMSVCLPAKRSLAVQFSRSTMTFSCGNTGLSPL